MMWLEGVMHSNMVLTSLLLLITIASAYAADTCPFYDQDIYNMKTISSHDFQEITYNNSPDVCWKFKANKGERQIRIQFTSFQLGPSNQTDCSYGSYLEIYSGYNTAGGRMGRWCGTRGPIEVNTTNNYMFILLHFPDFNKYSGFTANVKEFWNSSGTFSQFSTYIPIFLGVGLGLALIITVVKCFLRRKAMRARQAGPTTGNMQPVPAATRTTSNMHPVPGTGAPPPPGGVYNTAYSYSAQQANVYGGDYPKQQQGGINQPPPYMSQPPPPYPS